MSELYDILVETPPTKVILLALDQGLWDCERSLAELAALCEANHMEAVAEVTQKRQTPETGIVLGSGKLEEAAAAAAELGAECAVFDGELTGSQIRNISTALGGLEVIDRTMLILEIFRSRAVTNEGKLQTELALLRYRLPRLQGMGESLSRQGGGGGGGASVKKTTAATTEVTEETTEATTSKVVEGSTEATTNQIVISDNGEVKIVTPDGTEVKVNVPKDVVNSDVDFSDLGNYGWAKDYINKLAELGIVTGTEDGIYSPELGCKRGDFAILINRTLGLDVTPTKNFSDNEEGKYYYNDVRMGYTAGILSGYGDNTYKPEKYCNRDEMFVLVAKTLEYLGVDVTSTPTSVNNKYNDVADVAWWSAPYLAFLTQEGIVTGSSNGNVEPKKNINRAEMAVMMYKDYEYVKDYVDGLVKDAATTTTEETTEETTVDESASTTAETTTETTTVAE